MRLPRLYHVQTMHQALDRIAKLADSHRPPDAPGLGFRYTPAGNFAAAAALTFDQLAELPAGSDAADHAGALRRHEVTRHHVEYHALTRRFQALMAALPELVPVHHASVASARRQYDQALIRTAFRGAIVAEQLAERTIHLAECTREGCTTAPLSRPEWFAAADTLKDGAAAVVMLAERHPTPPGGLDAHHDRTAAARLVRRVRAGLRTVGRADLAEALPDGTVAEEVRVHLADLDQRLTLYPADTVACSGTRRQRRFEIGPDAPVEWRDTFAVHKARAGLAYAHPSAVPAARSAAVA